MFRSVPMVHVQAQVPSRDAARATRAIAAASLLHLVDIAHGRVAADAAPPGEVLLRELQARTDLRDRQRAAAAEALREARRRLAEARVELSSASVDAATLAQPPALPVERLQTHVAGVALPLLRATRTAFTPAYGPGGTAASLDQAGAAFVAALPPVLALASSEAGVRALAAALARTVRLLNALDRIVVPELAREIGFVEDALEEEERDECVRRGRRLGRVETR